MMPDLGKYAFAVLASYGVSLGLLVVIVGASLWQGARIKARLREVEARQGRDDG